MGKGSKRRNRKQTKTDAQATLDFLTGANKIADNLVPAKGPQDGSLKFDKDADELTIRNNNGEDITIRPEKPIEPDTLPVNEDDFESAITKLKSKRQDVLGNPMRELLLLTKQDGVDFAVGNCSAIVAPNFWRKVQKSNWRCTLLPLVEGDMFSDIIVTPLMPFPHKAKIVLALNATAICEVALSEKLVSYPQVIPRFAIMSCCLELIVEDVSDPSVLCGIQFLISHDTYMLGDTLQKRWYKRLDTQIYFESKYDVHRQYVLDISNGAVKRIIPGNRENYKAISEVEEAKKRDQLALMKKAREQDRPNFPMPSI